MRNSPLVKGASYAFVIFLALTVQSHAFQSGYDKGGICFYENTNFKGKKFCAKSGEKISQLKAPWNKNFSSLQLDGPVLVYVCKKAYFGGKCRFYNESQASFGKDWNDQIESIQIGFRKDKKNIASSNSDTNRRTEEPRREEKAEKKVEETAALKEEEKERKKPAEQKKERVTTTPEPERESREEDRRRADAEPDRRDRPDRSDRDDRDNVREREEEDFDRAPPPPGREDRFAQRDRDRDDGRFFDEDSPENIEEEEVKNEVCFFERKKYRGRSRCITSNASLDQLHGRWDDNISSIRVTGDVKIKICEDHFYGGECETYRSSKRFVGWHWNDRISSVKIRFLNTPRKRTERNTARRTPYRDDRDHSGYTDRSAQACFYRYKRFRGGKICIPAGKSVSLNDKWNDNIASLTLDGDVKVRVCEHRNLRGYCRTFYRDRKSLGFAWNGTVSSVKVIKIRRHH